MPPPPPPPSTPAADGAQLREYFHLVQGDRGKYSPTFPQEENRGIYSLHFPSRTGEYMGYALHSPRRGTAGCIPNNPIPPAGEQEDIFLTFPEEEQGDIFLVFPQERNREIYSLYSTRRGTAGYIFTFPEEMRGISHVPLGGEQGIYFFTIP